MSLKPPEGKLISVNLLSSVILAEDAILTQDRLEFKYSSWLGVLDVDDNPLPCIVCLCVICSCTYFSKDSPTIFPVITKHLFFRN